MPIKMVVNPPLLTHGYQEYWNRLSWVDRGLVNAETEFEVGNSVRAVLAEFKDLEVEMHIEITFKKKETE